jgi:hypothetical protein
MKNALWFLAGCLFAAVLANVIIPRLAERDVAQNAVRTAQVVGQLRGQQSELIKERDACASKFDRATVLYDVGLFNVETKAWVIPADVEPVLVTGKSGNYTHYDPKTQTETIHIKGKAVQ